MSTLKKWMEKGLNLGGKIMDATKDRAVIKLLSRGIGVVITQGAIPEFSLSRELTKRKLLFTGMIQPHHTFRPFGLAYLRFDQPMEDYCVVARYELNHNNRPVWAGVEILQAQPSIVSYPDLGFSLEEVSDVSGEWQLFMKVAVVPKTVDLNSRAVLRLPYVDMASTKWRVQRTILNATGELPRGAPRPDPSVTVNMDDI